MKRGKENKRKVKSVWGDKITKIRLDKEIGHMCWNKHNKRSGKHSVKGIKSRNNECRKCPKNAKNIRKNIPCDSCVMGRGGKHKRSKSNGSPDGAGTEYNEGSLMEIARNILGREREDEGEA